MNVKFNRSSRRLLSQQMNKRSFIPTIFVLVLGVMTGLALFAGLTDKTELHSDGHNHNVESAPSDGIAIYSGGYYVSPGIAEASRRSDLVVLATVEQQVEPFWNTPNRQRPEGTEIEVLRNPAARIFTPVRLSVDEILKGDFHVGQPLVLNERGGVIGNDKTLVPEHRLAIPSEGQTLLFLRDCGNDRATRLGHPGFRFRVIDTYIITDEGQVKATTSTDETGLPLSEVTATVESEQHRTPQGVTPC